MKTKIKIKGRLRTYLQTFLILGILLAAVDVWIYILDAKAGILLSVFVIIYLASCLLMLNYNKPIIMNELVSFATQYGQIQRQLLRDLELPHALLDENGKVIWTNKAFEMVVHKEKGYNKGIHTLFPEITKEKLPGEMAETQLSIVFEERDFEARLPDDFFKRDGCKK